MKNFTTLLIALLVAIILLQRLGCGKGQGSVAPGPDTVKITDTTWLTRTKTINKKVTVVKEEIVHDTVFTPEPMYEPLKEQYLELADEFNKRRIYQDTIVLDSIGHLYIRDTVRYNKLQGRSMNYHYKIPIVHEKTVINNHAVPKRQLYVGGGVSANKTNVASVQAGLLYKDRRDRMFGGFVGVTPSGDLSVGVQSYWKITLKK